MVGCIRTTRKPPEEEEKGTDEEEGRPGPASTVSSPLLFSFDREVRIRVFFPLFTFLFPSFGGQWVKEKGSGGAG